MCLWVEYECNNERLHVPGGGGWGEDGVIFFGYLVVTH